MDNDDIFKNLEDQYNKINGLRVGDWVRFPNGIMNRVTYIWDVEPERIIQTGGSDGNHGYFLGKGWISYSGGLDVGVDESKFTPTKETKKGWIWFFNNNYVTAHNGVYYEMNFRIFECSEIPAGQKGPSHLKTSRGTAELYGELNLTCITPEQHLRTCGYWYLVYNRSTSHTAFRTKEHLFLWLKERGLTINEPIPEKRGTFQSQDIVGSYAKLMMGYESHWDDIRDHIEVCKVLSNGKYTEGKITLNDDGIRIINYLNPNCNRMAFHYQATREALEKGDSQIHG